MGKWETCLGGTSSACSRRSGTPKRPFTASRFPNRAPLSIFHVHRCLTCIAYLYRVMIDCSRNGVLKVESVKTLLRHLALMGSNMLQVRLRMLVCQVAY